MRNRRVTRALAVSTITVLTIGVLIAAMRSSEADTPQPGATANATAGVAAPVSDTDPNAGYRFHEVGNRIRFGTRTDANAAAPAPTEQPIRVGKRYADYSVRQAAAEEPVTDDASPAAPTAPRAPMPPAASRPDPFAAGVPPVGPMPTPAAPQPPRAATSPYGTASNDAAATPTKPLASGFASASAAPATDSRYGTPSSTADRYATPPASSLPPANALPRAAATAAAAASAEPPFPAAAQLPAAARSAPPASSPSTSMPPAPFAATAATAAAPAPIPAAQPATRESLPPAAAYSAPPSAPAPIAASGTVATSSANAPTGVSGVGRPGEKALEGAQSPTLTIEKIAPQEIQVGKPAVFEIVVRNVGSAAASEVEIHDLVPQGTQLKSSNPAAARGKAGELVWLLGAMKPGDEARVQMELLPTTEGEIGSVATVRFAAAASVRTICTKPELLVEVQMPRTVLAGDDVPVKIRVSNPGTGIATGIFLTEIVPAGMEHTAGGELEYEVGNLQPNESRELELTLRAAKVGSVVNVIQGEGDGTLRSETKTQVEIVAPALTVAIEGPKRRYLDRQATYTVSLANPGTAAAKEVELATYLPKGMQFVEADNHGEYDASTHSVRWLLEELPAKEKGSVTVTTLPVEPGQQLLRVETSAARGVSAKKEEAIMVEGASSIVFQVVDTADPIEVGGETVYEVVVANQGSKEATNVQLTIALPEGMKALDADGPARFNIAARQVTFQPLAQLGPKQETKFRVRVQCSAAGDHRCHVQLTSDDMKTPVTKEEGTRVYADE